MSNAPSLRFQTGHAPQSETADWIPAVDIVEHDDCYVLLADLPGIAPENIEISLHENVLRLAGHRAGFADHQRRQGERSSGRFCRCFTLPQTVNDDGIAARSVLGTLEIRIPRSPAASPRRINVAAA